MIQAEIADMVFPVPNEHGVFDSRHAMAIEYQKKDFYVRVYVLQIAPDSWVSARSCQAGFSGASGPLTGRCAKTSFDEAVKQELVPVVAGLISAAAGTPQSGVYKTTPAIAKKAIFSLLGQIPLPLANSVLADVREGTKVKNG